MGEWQPMIDRCKSIADKINELLTRRAAIATSNDNLVVYKIDDLETIMFALRRAEHMLFWAGFDAAQHSERIAEVVEECAKIAAPWQGAWLDHNSTEADREVVKVRQGIADAIRLLVGCHCGKDGHALNSVNCPVHGYEISMKKAQDLANWEI